MYFYDAQPVAAPRPKRQRPARRRYAGVLPPLPQRAVPGGAREPVPHAYPPPPMNLFLKAAGNSKAKCVPVREMDWSALGKYVQAGAPPSLQQSYAEVYARRGLPFGAPTRGWRDAYPTRGAQRHELIHPETGCGPQCFLSPQTEGFPICSKLEVVAEDPRLQCLPMRQGVQAAYNRARQWRHQEIAETASELLAHVCPEPLSDEELDDYLRALQEARAAK